MYMSFSEISAEQKKPLDYKTGKALEAIAEGFKASRSRCAVAFSGGKDSTVLWHLIRENFPHETYEIIFGNTGVEFPESLAFARELGKEWGGEHFHEARPEKLEKDGLKYQAQWETLQWLIDSGTVGTVLKPDGKLKSTDALERSATPEMWEEFRRRNLVWKAGTMKSYFWCVDQYGYPILGKAASKLTARRINIDCFLMFSETTSEKQELKDYYELLRQVKISNHCCSILKKEPSEKLQAELGVDVIFKGLMASESRSRRTSFATRGYLFKSHRPHCGDFYHCSPLAIWTDDDIWEYIRRYDVPYSPLYDLTYVDYDKLERGDHKGCVCRIKRNGCIACATDIAFKDNHLSALRQTHPQAFEAFMKHGLGDQLARLYLAKKAEGGDGQIALDRYDPGGWFGLDRLIDDAPCAFDDLGEYLERDELTESEYDAEEDQLALWEETA